MVCAAFIVSLRDLTGCRTPARGNSPALQQLRLGGVAGPSAWTEEHLAESVVAGPAPELSTGRSVRRFAWWIIVIERVRRVRRRLCDARQSPDPQRLFGLSGALYRGDD
jgi:hypothetical protein